MSHALLVNAGHRFIWHKSQMQFESEIPTNQYEWKMAGWNLVAIGTYAYQRFTKPKSQVQCESLLVIGPDPAQIPSG